MLPLLHHPDPRLYTVCPPVTAFGPDLDATLDEMAVLMRQPHPGHPRGGVGLAGPQVGLMARVLVMRAGSDQPVVKLVNPFVASLPNSRRMIDAEGCLSLIDLRVNVERLDRICVVYQSPLLGDYRRDIFEGWEARIVQHEIDHLDGVTLVSRARRGARRDFERRCGKTPDRVGGPS